MSTFVTVGMFRMWAGVNVPGSVPDVLILMCLDEAESALVADVGCGTVDVIAANPEANPIGAGEVCRRAQNLLAKRNSPEGSAGTGEEGFIAIPSIPSGSLAAVRQIKKHLGIPVVVIA